MINYEPDIISPRILYIYIRISDLGERNNIYRYIQIDTVKK